MPEINVFAPIVFLDCNVHERDRKTHKHTLNFNTAIADQCVDRGRWLSLQKSWNKRSVLLLQCEYLTVLPVSIIPSNNDCAHVSQDELQILQFS